MEHPTTLFIAPYGDDANPGTLAKPFQTLERARNVVRDLANGMSTDIVIYLREGVYFLPQPFMLTAADSGQNGFDIVYRAYSNEKPVISGGRPVSGWELYDRTNNIYKAFIGQDVNFRQVYINGVRAIRARGDYNPPGFMKTDSGYIDSGQALQSWSNVSDVEFVYQREWVSQRCGIESVFGEVVVMKQPCFTRSQEHLPTAIQLPAWIENAYELMDGDGEWYFNRADGFLYYKPRIGENMNMVTTVIPVLVSLVTVPGEAGAAVHNVRFEGLTFAHTTWLEPSSQVGFSEIQANHTLGSDASVLGNPSSWKRPPAAIEVAFAHSLRFERNTLTQLGAMGMALGTGSHNNEIVGNQFFDISSSAVYVGGISEVDRFDPAKAAQGNLISNNYIHHVGVEYSGAPGIFIGYAGNTSILHNELAFLPYTGVSIGWGWGQFEVDLTAGQQPTVTARRNVVANNYIHHYMRVLRDGGGIYVLGSQLRSVITDNHIDNQANDFAGIYLDTGSQGFTVVNNVVTQAPRWLFVNGYARNNFVHDNFSDTEASYIDSRAEIELSGNLALVDLPLRAQAVVDRAGIESNYSDIRHTRQGENIAQGQPVLSSTSSRLGSAGAANDNDLTTFWDSSVEDVRPWLLIVLPGACRIGQVEIVARQNVDAPSERRDFEVQASNRIDFAKYDVLGRQAHSPYAHEGVWVSEPTVTDSYRYVRVIKSGSGPLSLSEIRLWNLGDDPYCNVASNGGIVASSVFSQQFDGTKANDNSISTGWSPKGDDPLPWWQLDLGEAYMVSTIELVTRQDIDQPVTRRNFEIRLSNDCAFSKYRVVGEAGNDSLDFKSTLTVSVNSISPSRYVRVVKTVSEYFYISEVKVWANVLVEPLPGYLHLPGLADSEFSACGQVNGPR